MRVSPIVALGAIGLIVAACTSDEMTGPRPPGPHFINDSVFANPINTISAVVKVRAAKFDSAFVRYWKTGGPVGQTPAYAFGTDSVARVPVLGLDTASAYSLEVTIVRDGNVQKVVDTAQFTSGSLPAWIPLAGVTGTDTTPGYLAISYPGGPVIIDNTGKVVWYLQSNNGVLNTFQAQGHGTYTLMGLVAPPGDPQYLVLNELGEQVDSLKCLGGYYTRFHEVRITAQGDKWLVCDQTRTMDLSAIGGFANAQVTSNLIQHLDANNQLLFQWDCLDHMQITDLDSLDRSGPAVNFCHVTAFDFDYDGNILMSFRALDEVTKVDAATGAIIWRFGGSQSQFTILNDPQGQFKREHGMRRGGPNEIQVLDNSLGPPSRFVRYLLNPVNHTALMTMEVIDGTTWSVVGGTTQYYPENAHSIVTFGRTGRVIEVDPVGNPVWQLTGVDGTYIFRVQRIKSLYTAGPPEPLP